MSMFLPWVLLAAGFADSPAEQPTPVRVVEGKPLTVTLVDTTEEGGERDGAEAKTIHLRVVGENIAVAATDTATATPGKKVPFIGVVTAPLSPAVRAQTDLGEDVGLSVDSVSPESPAAKAGLEPFDILARYDDQILCAPVQLSALVKRTGTGNTAKLTVIRRGREIPIEVTVGEHVAVAALALERVATQFGAPDPLAPAIVVGQPIDDDTLARLRQMAEQSNGETARLVQDVEKVTGDTNRLLERIGAKPRGVQPVPGVPVPPPAPGAGAQPNRRWVLVNPSVARQTQSTSVFSNDEGQVILRETDGEKTVTILDAEGKQQYAGPWGGADDAEKVPEALRDRVAQAIASAGPNGVWTAPAPRAE